MPACDARFLEALFFDRRPAGGIHVTQDTVLGPYEVRVWVEAGVEEGDSHTPSGEVRVGVDAEGRRQEPLFVARVHRKRCEQFGLKRGWTARLNRFLDSAMNTLGAGAIVRLPAMIIFAQNASDVVFEFGLYGKEDGVNRAATKGAGGGAVHGTYITGKPAQKQETALFTVKIMQRPFPRSWLSTRDTIPDTASKFFDRPPLERSQEGFAQ